jgi:hypothetical protein
MRESLLRAAAILVTIGLAFTRAVDAAPVTVSMNQSLVIPPYPANDFVTVDLDLNNDVVPDVRIVHQSFRETHINFADSIDTAVGLNGAQVLLTSPGSAAAALAPGQMVGPGGTFSAVTTFLINTEYFRDGVDNTPGNLDFLNPDVAMGVQIPVGGQNYYAWLGVQSTGNKTNQFGTNALVLHDFGYETSPNTPVAAAAPEPASGALLVGLGMIVARRRR